MKIDVVRFSRTAAATLGQYSFGSLAAGSYQVRVVNSTVRSTRPGAVASLLPVQTFRTQGGNGTADHPQRSRCLTRAKALRCGAGFLSRITLAGRLVVGDQLLLDAGNKLSRPLRAAFVRLKTDRD